jgi:hypothetical protein
MKTRSEKSVRTTKIGAVVSFTFLFLVPWSQNIRAQSNTFPSSGNVGIGTTNPHVRLSQKLDITASGNYGGMALNTWSSAAPDHASILDFNRSKSTTIGTQTVVASGDTLGHIIFRGSDGAAFQDAARVMASVDGTPGINDLPGRLTFWTTPDGSPVMSERMRINSAGNVGIGTTTPAYKLDIQGGSASSSSGYISKNNPWATADSAFFPNGITTAGATNWIYGGTTFIGNAPSNGFGHQFDGVTGASHAYLAIGGGNVGIGTTSPATKLHLVGDGTVTGNLTVTGNIAAKYQDVAEWVPATQALPPGTVVTLDPTKSNHVEASSKAYDTRVAGVISAQPGIAVGERGDNKVLVATTGRVKVKVDATRAPICIGDLLVTGETPGVAMKSEPITVGGRQMHSPGTLIGKALEPLQKGRGEILVLLSLQ